MRSSGRIYAVRTDTGRPALLTDLFPPEALLAALKADRAVAKAVPAAVLAKIGSLAELVEALRANGLPEVAPEAYDFFLSSFALYDFSHGKLAVRIALPSTRKTFFGDSTFVQLGIALKPKPEAAKRLAAEKKEARYLLGRRSVLLRNGGRWQ